MELINILYLFISACSRRIHSASYDPFYGEKPGPHDHWQFPCAYGNHERFCGGACVVGMCVSSYSIFSCGSAKLGLQAIPTLFYWKVGKGMWNPGLNQYIFYHFALWKWNIGGIYRLSIKYGSLIIKIFFRISGVEKPATVFRATALNFRMFL